MRTSHSPNTLADTTGSTVAATPAEGTPTTSQETALWKTDRTGQRRAALDEDITVDVAVVGAGYTGLWTAYYLLREDPSLRVAIVEREVAGFGASGRNGGWASAIFPISLARVAHFHGHTAALDLQHAMNDAVDEIGRVSTDEGIDCDYAKEGFISLARNPAQLARARASVKATEDFGAHGQFKFLDAAEAADQVRATSVLGATFTPHCAVIQPDHLVRGLAAWVESHGGAIYEDTPALTMESGRVGTPGGVVSAEVVVRATEAYTPEFPQHRREVAPLYSLVVATEPLPADLRSELGLDGRKAFNDLRNLRIYAQSTADGRIVFGGRGAPYHFMSRVDPRFDTDTRIHNKIVDTMHDFFPQLRDVPIAHRWGGPLGVPRDWFPSVGLDRSRGIAWAGPYVGDGVATSNLAARVLRNLILNKPDELNSLPIVDHRSPRWEIEPFRWVGVNAGLAAAELGNFEERITKRPSKISALLERLTGAH
ncbi:NAD(P)/FAD-dependent oxidoreductase [Brevibacterium sediminis]